MQLAARGHRRASTWRLAATIACAVATLAATPAEGRPLVTGIADPQANALGDQTTFDRIGEAGAGFVRLTILWHEVAPKSEPLIWIPTSPADLNYDWSSADREVEMATRAGLEPLFQVYGAPSWAQRCATVTDFGAPCDPDPAALADFAEAAARRYSGSFLGLPRVRYWEPQNEPNLQVFFNPQFRNGRPVSPSLYRTLLNRFSDAVKSVDSSNLVVTAGFGPLERPGSIGPLDFVRRMLCMRGRRNPRPAGNGCEGGVRFDVLATNPFTTGAPTREGPKPDDVSLGDLPEMRRLLRAAERAGRIDTELPRVPFWVTELSWDSKPPDPGGLREGLHARWAAEAIYRSWLAGVEMFMWYELRDNAREGSPHDQTVQSGLYLRGETVAADRPKLALQAFRFPFVAFRRQGGIYVWGRTATSTSGRVVLEGRTAAGWRQIGTARARGDGIFAKLLGGGFGKRRQGLVRARHRGVTARPFSLKPVRDFYHPPFG
jgi:hypothetical protein